jgi:hypothetical protein
MIGEDDVLEELKKIYPGKDKPKKKFVYLDKYETYKEEIENKFKAVNNSINTIYILLGVMIVLLTLITYKL